MTPKLSGVCLCTHEQGDSDCPVHVVCSECGADISHQTVVSERARLAAEVRRLREESRVWRLRAEQCSAGMDRFQAERDALRAEQCSAGMDRFQAERDALREENARLQRVLDEQARLFREAACEVDALREEAKDLDLAKALEEDEADRLREENARLKAPRYSTEAVDALLRALDSDPDSDVVFIDVDPLLEAVRASREPQL